MSLKDVSRYGGSVVGELCTQTHTVNMCSFLSGVCDTKRFETRRLFLALYYERLGVSS